jgi:hypothetical protein
MMIFSYIDIDWYLKKKKKKNSKKKIINIVVRFVVELPDLVYENQIQ